MTKGKANLPALRLNLIKPVLMVQAAFGMGGVDERQ